jgi:zinc/manganese transport system permease protein
MSLTTELTVLGPALLAGLLVLATHVPLGEEVLKRGIVFIDLAIAQIAVLGVIAAEVAGFEPHGLSTQVVAVAAALLGAGLLAVSERRLAEKQEAVIGVLFVLAASIALLLLSRHPHGAEHLKELLEGQILWIETAALAPVAVLYAGVLGVWFAGRARLGRAGFYPLFAVTVTASVQLVGVYLVFASLIVPALAAGRARPARRLALAWGVGASAYLAGLGLSLAADLPAAPVVVCLLALVGAGAYAATPASRA